MYNTSVGYGFLIVALVICLGSCLEASPEKWGSDGKLLSPGQFEARVQLPHIRIYPLWNNGSVFEETYLSMTFNSVSEGFIVPGIPITFTDELIFSGEDFRNFKKEEFNSTIKFVDGTTTTVHNLAFYLTLPSPKSEANLTLLLQTYDDSGRFYWGDNLVNATKGALKYNTFLSNWNTTDFEINRVRFELTAGLFTGRYTNESDPTASLFDWDGPARALLVDFPTYGPFSGKLMLDCWASVDGKAADLAVAPNPIYSSQPFNKSSSANNNSITATFGWVIPQFVDEAAWDPTILVSLFGNNFEPSTSPADKKSRTPMIIGVTVSCSIAVLAVIGVAIAWKIHIGKNGSRQRQLVVPP